MNMAREFLAETTMITNRKGSLHGNREALEEFNQKARNMASGAHVAGLEANNGTTVTLRFKDATLATILPDSDSDCIWICAGPPAADPRSWERSDTWNRTAKEAVQMIIALCSELAAGEPDPQAQRFEVSTTLHPSDPAAAALRMETTWKARMTEAEFMEMFPQGNLSDALCHNGRTAEGSPRTYNGDDVLECERDAEKGPSHQAMMAAQMIELETGNQTDAEGLRPHCLDWNGISAKALAMLIPAADGEWEPEADICREYAEAARNGGLKAADYLRQAENENPA